MEGLPYLANTWLLPATGPKIPSTQTYLGTKPGNSTNHVHDLKKKLRPTGGSSIMRQPNVSAKWTTSGSRSALTFRCTMALEDTPRPEMLTSRSNEQKASSSKLLADSSTIARPTENGSSTYEDATMAPTSTRLSKNVTSAMSLKMNSTSSTNMDGTKSKPQFEDKPLKKRGMM